MLWPSRRRSGGSLASFRAPPIRVHAIPAWRAAALTLPDGAPLGEALAAELKADMALRVEDIAPHWSVPTLSNLHVRWGGVPQDWTARRNLFLLPPESDIPAPMAGWDGEPPSDCVVAIGAGVRIHQTHISGSNTILAIGDGTQFPHSSASACTGATLLIGEGSTSTFMAQVDGRNGGRVLIGADGMWANQVRLMSDDMHTIRDVSSGKRLNRRGGTIIVEPHAWLCENVTVMGDSEIGRDAVVGTGSIIKSVSVPANTVCAGRPPRILRTGTTWSREDLP